MTPTERVLEERAKHLADEINKGHYVTVDDLLEQFTLTRREALLEAAEFKEAAMKIIYEADIMANAVESEDGVALTKSCERYRGIRLAKAFADKESEQ